MNRAGKILPLFSILIGCIFAAICLLVHPLWSDKHSFLGVPNLPVVQILAIFAGGYVFYVYWVLRTNFLTLKSWLPHVIIMVLVDATMLILIGILIKELGYESVVIPRMAAAYLPIVFWVSLAVVLFWVAPIWKPLRKLQT